MKYLRKFSESVSKDFLLDLQDFCESNLAYLLDDGLKVTVMDSVRSSTPMDKKPTDISIALIFIRLSDKTKWSDIKDFMNPFFSALKSEYDIVHDKVGFRLSKGFWNVYKREFNIDDILADNIQDVDRWSNGSLKYNLERDPIIRFEIRVKVR